MNKQIDISNFQELKSALSTKKEGQTYILTADIDCGGALIEKELQLGAGCVLDGNGHSILNFQTNKEIGKNGIFDLATTGRITFCNLTFGASDDPLEIYGCLVNAMPFAENGDHEKTVWENVNAYVDLTCMNGRDIGVFFGVTIGDHRFTNCHVTVTAAATNVRVGGFIGRYYGTSLVMEGCSVNGCLKATENTLESSAGGFLGALGERTPLKIPVTLSMTRCVNNAIIEVTAAAGKSFAGGLIGYVWDSRRTLNITATLKNCENNGFVSSNISAGGIIGHVNTFDPTVQFISCVNNGEISGASVQTSCIGGIIGTWHSVNKGYFDHCVNTGKICCASVLGGLLGLAERGFIDFDFCYNSGDMVATAGSHVGGLAGRVKDTARIRNCLNVGAFCSSDGIAVGNLGQLISKCENSLQITNCCGFGRIDCDAVNCGAIAALNPIDFSYSENFYLSSDHINNRCGIDEVCGCIEEKDIVEQIKVKISEIEGVETIRNARDEACLAWKQAFGNEFPIYGGGTMNPIVYTDNVGYAKLKRDVSKYKMFLVYGTTQNEFDAYTETLKACGCDVKRTGEKISGVTAYWVQKDSLRMYMYFVAKSGDARFILDVDETQTSIEEFSYGYDKQPGDTTTYYMYGVKMNPFGVNIKEVFALIDDIKYPELAAEINPQLIEKQLVVFNEETGKWEGKTNYVDKNCGMIMFVKLADNSLIWIDGGEKAQMSQEAGIHLNEFLHQITNTPKGERVKVRAWFLTHYHGDHFGGFIRFMRNFHEQYHVERVMCNLRNSHLPPWLQDFLGQNYLQGYYPNIMFHRLHTGETIRLGDVEIDVMYTGEDLVNTKTATFFSGDDNDTTTVLRFRFDGKSLMALGDIAGSGGIELLNMYEPHELHADVMQVPHHGINYLPNVFSAVNPKISVFAQSKGGARALQKGYGTVIYDSILTATAGGEDCMFFAGNETVGISVVDGEVRDVFHEPSVGAAYDGSDGGVESFWDDFDLFPMNNSIV